MMDKNVYVILGRGNAISESDTGKIIASLGFGINFREILPPFSRLGFSEQIAIIKEDLRSCFWSDDARLIGHSYGAYLLLQSLVELEPFPGKVLLLSPVLGSAIDKTRLYLSRPPRADKLLNLAEVNQFPAPAYLEIHTGEKDNGCDPELALRIGSLISTANVHVLPDQGHQLPVACLKRIIPLFLER